MSASLVIVLISAAPADAHTLTGVSATNFDSSIRGITPPIAGVHVRLLDLGRRIELSNAGHDDVIVEGYSSEPYLRVGPRGIDENFRSPSHFLNKPQPAGVSTNTTLPRRASSTAPPEWHHRSSSHTVRWRDRRTRWEGPSPAVVRLEPHRSHVVATWTIPLQHNGRASEARGDVRWDPGPSATRWLVVAMWLMLATVLLSRLQRFGPPLAALLFVLVTSDVVHTIAQVGASRERVLVVIARVLLGGIFSLAAWVTAVVALRPLFNNREGAALAGGVAAFFVAMLTGIGDVGSLGHSHIPSLLQPDVVRALVSVCLGLGVGLTLATLEIGRRTGWWSAARSGGSEPA